MDVSGWFYQLIGLTTEGSRKEFIAVAGAVVAVVSAGVSLWSNWRQKRHMDEEKRAWEVAKQTGQSERLMYLHRLLNDPHYANARRRLRKATEADINAKQHEDEVDIVCAGYDQAGFILLINDLVTQKDREALLKSSWGASVVDQYEKIRKRELHLESVGVKIDHTTQNFFTHFRDLYSEACSVRKHKPPQDLCNSAKLDAKKTSET